MSCGYFRIFLTILVAFGSFFGYLCRLNLSLVIEEMVVKKPSATELTPLATLGSDVVPEFSPRRLTALMTEEHTFAELSATNWWVKQRSLSRRVKLKASRKNISRSAPYYPFNIDFDVSANGLSKSIDLTGAKPEPPDNFSKRPEATSDATENDAPGQEAAGLLNWNDGDKNNLLGVFFYGYVIFQVPAGRAAEIFGPKPLLLWLGLGSGLSSLIFPYAARFSQTSLIFPYAIRIVMGASQAGLFPAAYVLLCRWLPKSERSSWLAVPSAMGRFGTIAMNLIVPIIMLNYTWEWVFYASGLITLFWTLLIAIFAANKPIKSWWLSRNELIYIESRMEPASPSKALASLPTSCNVEGGSTLSLEAKPEQTVAKPSIDWFKMLRSRALLMLAVVMFTSEWSNLLLLIKLPGFLGPALKMEMKEIALMNIALMVIFCVGYPLSGVVASQIEARQLKGMNSLRVRKLFEATAQIMQALGCFAIAIFQDKTIVLSALITIMIGRAIVGGGQCLMPPELSKDYPGSVLALANSIANCAGFVGPALLTVMVRDSSDYSAWRNWWLLSGGIFVLGGVLFCWLADNRPQNYCKRPKLRRAQTTSLANLVLPAAAGCAEESRTKRRTPSSRLESDEIIRMGSFARVSSEPQLAKTTPRR